MAVRIEVHGKEREKIKYSVEFRCSSCGCEFWVDADSLGEFKPANYCDLKNNCPECGSSSYPVDIMENSRIFSEHEWEPVFWQIIESPFHRYCRICDKEK